MQMLKEADLPAPDAVIDYGDVGFGPVMFHWATEGQDLEHIAREAGFDCLFVTLEEDVGYDDDHPLMKEYSDGSAEVVSKWTPKEQGDGWKLVAKHDTDDGPVAIFIRPHTPDDEATA